MSRLAVDYIKKVLKDTEQTMHSGLNKELLNINSQTLIYRLSYLL